MVGVGLFMSLGGFIGFKKLFGSNDDFEECEIGEVDM